MECEKCKQKLEEGVTLCPACGHEHQPEEPAPVNEEVMDPKEQEETAAAPVEDVPAKKKMTSGKLAVVYICIIVLLASLIAPVIVGLSSDTGNPSASAEGTVPTDGNKDDVTCQGSYTVSDRKAKSKADKVVATAGDAELTNEMLQSIYWLQVYNFLSNYGGYGINTDQPLDQQICSLSAEGWTWQQYFLDVALQEWQMYNAFCQEAEAVGYETAVDVAAIVESMKISLADAAETQGYGSVDEMILADMGAGASLEAYLRFVELTEKGYDYYGHLYEAVIPAEDQVHAYYEENLELFEQNGITDDGSVLVDVRHILIQPADKENEQEWLDSEQKAQALLDQWLSGDADEGSFAALANEHSQDPGSNTVGGLYELVQEGQMVQEFNDWCFDEGRQYGDYGIVKTSHGYHLMFFVRSQPVWYVYAESSVKSEMLNDTLEALLEKYPADVDYSKIVLGAADLSSGN